MTQDIRLGTLCQLVEAGPMTDEARRYLGRIGPILMREQRGDGLYLGGHLCDSILMAPRSYWRPLNDPELAPEGHHVERVDA